MNRKWVTVPICYYQEVKCHDQQGVSNFAPLFCSTAHCISSHNQQAVSKSALIYAQKSQYVTSFHDKQDVSEPFSTRQSPHLSSHNKQEVSGTALVYTRSSPMSNRKWVILFFRKSQHILHPWPIGCEWQCPLFYLAISTYLIPWTASKWHCILVCSAVSSYLIPWPTECE